MGENTFVCIFYGRKLRDEGNDKNGVRQGGISSGILFNICLNEIIFNISKLLNGCTLYCSRVNMSGYADDLILFAPTAQALQILLNVRTSKLYTLSLQVNVLRLCNTVFRYSSKSVNKLDHEQPYADAIDFFRYLYSLYNNFSFIDINCIVVSFPITPNVILSS